jgi:hypothetical protein
VMEPPAFPREGRESFGIGSEHELDTVVSGLETLERDPTQDHSCSTELLSYPSSFVEPLLTLSYRTSGIQFTESDWSNPASPRPALGIPFSVSTRRGGQ